MLIVVEDWDFLGLGELLLDLEALGGRDVLEVDPCEPADQVPYGGDLLLVCFPGVDADRHKINSPQKLKKAAFPFHHRQPRPRPDIAQPQNSSPICDNCTEGLLAGQFFGLIWVFLDGFGLFVEGFLGYLGT